MRSSLAGHLRKLGSLAVFISLALVVVSCSSEDSPTTALTVNRAPLAPALDTASGCPADAATGVSPAAVLHWTCTDPDGDALGYTVRLGSTNPPGAVSTGQSATSYDPPSLNYETTYYWQIAATDPDEESTTSALWSFTTGTAPSETISTPDAPSGPASGERGEILVFTTSTAVSSEFHLVYYDFEWDQAGTQSIVQTPSASHTWVQTGTYDIRVRAYCSIHPNIESAWSPTTQVTITDPAEAVSVPQMKSSIVDIAGVNEDVWVSCYNATNTLGHAVEYRFDMNDGTITEWAGSTFVYHAWTAAGSYTLRAQARCVEHPDIASEWTPANYTEQIQISDAAETISVPLMTPSGEVSRPVGQAYSYSGSATSSLGHGLQYQFEWGNGETGPWGIFLQNHTYTELGSYQARVRARCSEHPEIESEWSVATTVKIEETISSPDISGPAAGLTGTPISFTSNGATSSEGHALEYRLYVSHSSAFLGTPQEWTTLDDLTHTFDTARSWWVRIQARCIEHQTEGAAANAHSIAITAP